MSTAKSGVGGGDRCAAARRFYRKVGGLRYLFGSFNSVLTPVMGLWGVDVVTAVDRASFAPKSKGQ